MASNSKRASKAFLARYSGATKELYATDLRIYFDWCSEQSLNPLKAKRGDLERFSDYMRDVRSNRPASVKRRLQTLKSFYALAQADDYIEKDPTRMLRMPKVLREPERLVWLDRFEMGSLLHQAEKESPNHHVLVALMTMLGLRVSAACALRFEDIFEVSHGQLEIRVREKGGRTHVAPVPPDLRVIIESVRDGRTEGPVVLTRRGTQQTRQGAYVWMQTIARKSGVGRANPHALRRGAICMAIDYGISMPDVCKFAGHADMRTTQGYHPNRGASGLHASFAISSAISAVS